MQLLRSKSWQRLTGIFICALILLLVILLFWPKHHQQHVSQPLMVKVATVQQKPMPIELKMPGIIKPSEVVTVQSQVSGIIQSIGFHYGENVKAGQLLFKIDPAPFESQLHQAKANLAQDQAQMTLLESDLLRYATLVKKGYISSQEYDQAKSDYETQKAKIMGDAQAVKQAQIALDYTRIMAPISGKTGNVTLKVGDLVSSGNNQTLVTISQLTPIEVDFYLPQSQLPILHYYHQQHANIQAEIWQENVSKPIAVGRLFFVDNQIMQSGSILLKVMVDNKSHELWPGQMVAVKLILTTQPDAIVIPTRAIQTDEKGNFIYRLAQQRAVLTRIVVDRQMGADTVVKSGLKPGEDVISVMPPHLTDQSLVQVEKS